MNESLRIVAVPEAAGPIGFEEFVAAEHARLYSALCLITHDRHEAEDVMQDALLKVW